MIVKLVRGRFFYFGVLAIVALIVVAVATAACEPTRAAFEVRNDTGRTIDFIYSEDFIDLTDFGRDYAALQIGDTDTYQGCTQCDVPPGGIYRFDEPFQRGQSVTMVARVAETDALIFLRSYTWQELFDRDWKVSLVDES